MPFRRSRTTGTAGTPKLSTSLASSASTLSGRPRVVQQTASEGHKNQEGCVKDDILEAAVVTASLAKEAVSNVSAPGLAAGFSVLVEILKKIQVMSETVKGIGDLTQDVNSLVKAATDFFTRNPEGEIPEVLWETIEGLTSKLTEIEKRATKLASQNRVKRFLRSASDAKKLENFVREISASIQRALLRGGWDIQLAVGKLQQKLDEEVVPKLNAMAIQQDETCMPTHAESAAFDAKSARPRESCLDGTREDMLTAIQVWIKLRTWSMARTTDTRGRGASMSAEEAQGFIHWICGLAGTGKTTIACSIAKWCKQEGILGASFFFSRFDSKCDNPCLLFTTISRQLCRVSPAYKARVIAVMKDDPDVVNSVAVVQFEKLILEPLEQLTEPFPRLTIVIDALDECRGDDSTSTIFYILSRFKDRVARFFIFIMTSRPDPEIVAHFDLTRSGPLGEVTTRLFLHTVELEPVLQDINRFLTHHLKETVSRRFPQGRPSDEDITTLGTISEGLFIFARTTVNLLTDKKSIDPVATLERIIQRQSRRSNSVSILEELYSQVLEEAHPDAEEELQNSIRRIVGTLVVATEPLSVAALAGLLDLAEYVVWNVLSGLYSVLHIPDDNSHPIHFIHPTFPEFLLQASPTIPVPSRFSIEATERHSDVFVRCLTTMGASLQYDIAKLGDPRAFKKDISDLSDRIQRRIPSHLSYACRNWVVHFRLGSRTPAPTTLYTSFDVFLRKHLLHWLEACSLLNTLGEAPAALNTARHTCQPLGEPFSRLVPFLLDSRRFVLTYAPCINTAPLQVYHSVLALAPSGSLVSQTYSHVRRKESLAVCLGASYEWGTFLDELTGHGGKVVSFVAFSPDNTFFVDGGNDGVLEVWQASTRTLVSSIEASRASIHTVAYSPNGLHIVVGGWAGLSIWHAASGARIRTITIANDFITHVTYTADGDRLLSISNSGKVQLWRVSDGECLLNLAGGQSVQAGITPDGAVIAFTRGDFLLLYDAHSGNHESLELPDKGRAATFSSDGRYVAAATKRIVQIWSHRDKSLVRSIDVPNPIKSQLAFSNDSSRICCGCDDGSVYIWPIEGDGPVRVCKGHTDWVRDVAWSPDSSQIVSASDDGTLRLWDAADRIPVKKLHPSPDSHSSGPPRVSIAHCGGDLTVLDLPPLPIAAQFLSSNDDSTANNAPTFTLHASRAAAWDHVLQSTPVLWSEWSYYWAALTGQNEFSTAAMTVVSHDNSLVAYPLGRDICVRSLSTGLVVATLTPDFESGEVLSLKFSPDNSLLVSGSGVPATVAVWDIRTEACNAYHHDHSDRVRCVTFSSDIRFVVSGSEDRTARFFDISTQQVTCVLEPHKDWVMRMMLTTDDRLLVTVDDLGVAYIWNIKTKSCITSFPLSHEAWITTLHFSPAGLLVLVDDDEHAVELWKPSDRVWPVYHTYDDGWVYAKGPGYIHRLVWLPPGWRVPVFSDGAIFGICEVDKGEFGRSAMRNVIELDMSRLLDHVGILYAR